MELSRGESISDLDFESPPWMYGNATVTVASPPRIAPSAPPPRPEDIDRVVQEALIEKLTERADLQHRVDKVHNAGDPDVDTCGMALRALWAVPLLFVAKGINLASKPLVGCCSVGLASSEKLCTVEETSPLDPSRNVDGNMGEPQLSDAQQALVGSSPAFPVAPVVVAPQVPIGPASLQPDMSPEAQEVIEEQPKAKPKAKKKHGSVVSMSSNVQSAAGNLLAGFAKAPVAGRSKATGSTSAPSVIGAPVANSGMSLAGATLPVASKAKSKAAPSVIGASPVTSGMASSFPGMNQAPLPVAAPSAPPNTGMLNQPGVVPPKAIAEGEAIPKRRPKAGQNASKSVVSTNFQSNSAASNLLGPMMARQGKQPGAKRAPTDQASAIG